MNCKGKRKALVFSCMNMKCWVSLCIITTLKVVWLGAAEGASVSGDTSCQAGEYLHGGYNDHSDLVQPGAECRRCPKETFNRAANNRDIRCAPCRQACDSNRGEIESQKCLSVQDRLCVCNEEAGDNKNEYYANGKAHVSDKGVSHTQNGAVQTASEGSEQPTFQLDTIPPKPTSHTASQPGSCPHGTLNDAVCSPSSGEFSAQLPDSTAVNDNAMSLPSFPPQDDASDTQGNHETTPGTCASNLVGDDSVDSTGEGCSVGVVARRKIASRDGETTARNPLSTTLKMEGPNQGSITQHIYNINIDNKKQLAMSSPSSTTLVNNGNAGCTNTTNTAVDNRQYNWSVRYNIMYEQAKTVLNDLVKEKDHVFVRILDVLLNDLEMDSLFSSILLKHRALSRIQCEEIDNVNRIPTEKAALCIAYVQKKGDPGLAYFIVALHQTAQQHIINNLVQALKKMDRLDTLHVVEQIIETAVGEGEVTYEHVLSYYRKRVNSKPQEQESGD